jgi:hypothetical protein
MCKWTICPRGWLIKYMTKMPGDVLGVWIEPFGLVELPESGVNAGIPVLAKDIRGGQDGGESQTNCILRAKTLDT